MTARAVLAFKAPSKTLRPSRPFAPSTSADAGRMAAEAADSSAARLYPCGRGED